MRKLLLLISSLFVLLNACNSVNKKEEIHKGYVINGAAPEINKGLVYLINNQNIKIDSSNIVNNAFRFKGIVNSPERHQLQVKNQPKSHVIILENSNYTIILNKNSAIISGGNLNMRQQNLSTSNASLDTEKLAVLDSFILGEIKPDSLKKSIIAIESKRKKTTTDYIIDNAGNLLSSTLFTTKKDFSLEELKSMVANIEVAKTTILKNLLTEEISRLQKVIDNDLAEKKKIAAAKKIYRKPAIMFSGDGINRELISLKSIIKGKKIVLIDFWASWCGPCRMVTPRVRQLYNQYKNKGFTILTVSEDKTREAWKNGIEQDQMLDWYHIFDDYGRISTMYNVRSIPYMVLIDGNGGIIKEKVSITELEYQLKKLL